MEKTTLQAAIARRLNKLSETLSDGDLAKETAALAAYLSEKGRRVHTPRGEVVRPAVNQQGAVRRVLAERDGIASVRRKGKALRSKLATAR